ncbi:Oleate-induced peroxisomal protein POX18 [Zancudomyces culisetae]|uniref:Oleate-induced peroxisomal protein POX18 n=1 Tax=Zancudomyces culisetae TaxID=1213189 RepID=A0A1R1PTB1_ZANCU|nr:Oleate-induced peroxisomal protein POX18 [Zancudomyces culisetae]|eukprot:OMH84191.1 Oleate-induced peroxisomal protein POX18 [Zancudomyces culisetae]
MTGGPGSKDEFQCAPLFLSLSSKLNGLDQSHKQQLIESANGVFGFVTKSNKTNKLAYWVIDLKKNPQLTWSEESINNALKQLDSKHGRVDVVVSTDDETLLQILRGKINAMQAFSSGKLRVKGSMAVGMRLEPTLRAFRTKTKAKTASTSQTNTKFKATENLLGEMKAVIKTFSQEERQKLLTKVNLIAVLKVTNPENSNESVTYTLNLSKGNTGEVVLNGPASDHKLNQDITVTVNQKDFELLSSGKLNGQSAYMRGKLKLQGNIFKAMSLDDVFQIAKKQKLKAKL